MVPIHLGQRDRRFAVVLRFPPASRDSANLFVSESTEHRALCGAFGEALLYRKQSPFAGEDLTELNPLIQESGEGTWTPCDPLDLLQSKYQGFGTLSRRFFDKEVQKRQAL